MAQPEFHPPAPQHSVATNIQLQYRNCSSRQQYPVQSVTAHTLVFREPDTDQLEYTLHRLLIEDPLNFSSQLTYVIMTSAGIKVHDMTISSRYFGAYFWFLFSV